MQVTISSQGCEKRVNTGWAEEKEGEGRRREEVRRCSRKAFNKHVSIVTKT